MSLAWHLIVDFGRECGEPMANDEHVRILKEGAAIWNAWREEHPEIKPDLHGADLKGCP